MSPRNKRGWKVWLERGGKNWRCRWRGIYGTDQEVFVFKDDAEEFARDKRRDFQRMDAGMPPVIRPKSAVTVAQWWATYSKTKARENPETFRRFDTPALTPFVEKHGGLALLAVDEEIVKDYKYELEDKYSGDTPQMYYRQLCAFFNAAVRAKHLTESPAKNVKKPASGGGGGRPLLDSELVALLTLAPEALYRTGVFSQNTLLRINEVLMLDWAWVSDIEVQTKQGPVVVWFGRIPSERRKTRAKVQEDCIFPINAAAREVMGERKLSGRIFPWAARTVQQQMTETRRRAKLSEDVTFHCFRHTGASRYLSTEGPDSGHAEDLLKSRIWVDMRSLLRYANPSPTTLFRRFSAMQYPVISPSWPPNAKPQGHGPRGT